MLGETELTWERQNSHNMSLNLTYLLPLRSLSYMRHNRVSFRTSKITTFGVDGTRRESDKYPSEENHQHYEDTRELTFRIASLIISAETRQLEIAIRIETS